MKASLRRKLVICFALVMALALACPCAGFAQDYDNTLPSDELAQQMGNDSNGTDDPEPGTTVDPETPTTGEPEPTTAEPTEPTEPTEATETTTTTTVPVYTGKNAVRIPVITYHRLSSAAEKKHKNQKRNSLFLPVSVFEKQMKWLYVHGYRTISTEEFYLWYTGRIRLPEKSVLITFDDGSYSIIKYALPILKKYHMKGTVFMIGKNTGNRTNTAVHKNGSYSCIGTDVMAQVQADYPDLEFQSHTYNMHRKIKGKPALKKVSYAAQKADFNAMNTKYGYTVMAYPYGKYTSTTIKAVRDSSIKMAFTYGTNAYATKKQSRYAIKRIKISANQPMKKFYKWFKK